MSAERWLYVGLFGLIGCGPLAGGDYYGEPLFEIEGSVQADFQLDYDGDIGVALLWSNETDLAAQAVLVETRFPARYKLKIFRPPAQDSALQVIGGQVLEASVGQILLFEDRNSDGVWNAEDEALVGGAYNSAVLYVPDANSPYDAGVDVPQNPNGAQTWIPSGGFHFVEVGRGAVCEVEWESWMSPLDASRATLYVGYFDALGTDWDCDGRADFNEESLAPPVQGNEDWNFDECPPFEVMLQECDYARELLDAGNFQPGADDVFGLAWLAEYRDCYLQVCPEVVEAYLMAFGEP